MNKLTDLLVSGPCNRPTGQFWYGPEGTRKTGSAVSPQTLILDLERGSDQYDVDRIHIETYHDLIHALDLIIHEKSQHEIIAVDPIEIAEKLLINETCRQLKIDGLKGLAHGAAWQYMRENFDRELMARFSEIRRTGRHMVIIGHAQVRTVTLPGLAEPFDRYEPRIDRRNADTLIEWADHVLFFDWDIRTAKNRDGIVRALSGNEPIVRIVHGPGWTAKNRVGLTEPLKPEFSALRSLFETLMTAGSGSADRPGEREDRPGAGVGVEAPAATAPAAVDPEPPPQAAQPAPPPGAPTPGGPQPLEGVPAPRKYDDIVSELTRQEIRAADALLTSLPQDRLMEFLQNRKLIGAGGDYHELEPAYIRRILNDSEGFREAVANA
jgi:hypothetical protein